ncbi:extracellular solute-binding protein [Pseudonocardia kujensis]|uniref:ABC transporter substrate-binding protein n=1 Tax=Pseudonocardia kujensis TaxID=1128675 RepID=UPI001E5C3867|nr:extracellular solute-binding protein [Pseudonocardia kujensis]MCE0762045.1 extracellular solute-binding protein [Pseudonocardia kujensis]
MAASTAMVASLTLACGSGGGQGSGAEGPKTVAEVLAAVDGLQGEARRQKLVELAEAEDRPFRLYSASSGDVVDAEVEAFTNATGVRVESYRASATDLTQRVLTENQARYADGADVLFNDYKQMLIYSAQGLLQPLPTPAAEGIDPAFVRPDWIGATMYAYVAAWNADQVSTPPRSWPELLTQFKGRLAIFDVDYDWFATLVQDMVRQGMSEDAAVDLFRQAARGSQLVDQHTLGANLLAAGQYPVVTSAFGYRIDVLKKGGAPVDWQPAVTPVVALPLGLGIPHTTDNPASAVLYVEWRLGDTQKLMADEFALSPTNPQYGGVLAQYPGQVLTVDEKTLTVDEGRWKDLYAQVVRGTSGKVTG